MRKKTQDLIIEVTANHVSEKPAMSRRDFVRKATIASGTGYAAVVTGLGFAQQGGRGPRGGGFQQGNGTNGDRAQQALQVRTNSAQQQQQLNEPVWATNGDETALDGFVGNFAKTLPHNDVGEVDPAAYQSLLLALTSGQRADFDTIPAGGSAKLANPRAAYSYALSGADSHKIDMPAVHGLQSKRQAAEAAEVYWMALCRDIPFDEYESNSTVQAAASDLSTFTDFTAPREGASITPSVIFRGLTPGDLQGGYVSEFLKLDIPQGNSSIAQSYYNPVAGDDYMLDVSSWLAVQRGQFDGTQNQLQFDTTPIRTARDLAEYVHHDFAYQAYLNAALICLGFGSDALDSNAYSVAAREGGFVTFGPAAILDLVARAARIALRPAWVHKWLVHRKLRPEVFGGRIEHMRLGVRDYGVDSELLNSQALASTFSQFGTYLLPQAYPEGSPTHPSYPAGHATIAGACVTVLKAYFDENYTIPGSGGLTLGGELNKLASNIANGRNMAGVHWRADGDDGLKVGEEIAVTLLQDELRTVTETTDAAFGLTSFDGNFINIQA